MSLSSYHRETIPSYARCLNKLTKVFFYNYESHLLRCEHDCSKKDLFISQRAKQENAYHLKNRCQYI
uniref:Uncharacterized protein n=1 Tax=Anopheles minimus TaxID=112268 RepID=A0A182W6K8_9DIPT